MDASLQQALSKLAIGPRPFFVDFKERCLFAQLVMMGLARCFVKEDRSEWVRLATDAERAVGRNENSALADNVNQERR